MDLPIEQTEMSEKSIKGFLIKNVDPTSRDPAVMQINKHLIRRADEFWDDVVVPLREMGKFDQNKLLYYFDLYCEGREGHRSLAHPFQFVQITKGDVSKLIEFLQAKTIEECLELGSSFLSTSSSMLMIWHRDQMLLRRLESLYSSENPHEWILRSLEDESQLEPVDTCPGIVEVLGKLSLILSRKI